MGQSEALSNYVLESGDGDEATGYLAAEVQASSDYRIDPDASTARFEVVDTDPPPTLSAADASASEGAGSVDFTVSLAADAASRQTVTVDYAITGVTASAADGDYTDTSGTFSIQPGVTSKTLSVPVTEDSLLESNETFTVTFSNPVNAVLPEGKTAVTVTGTIEDNEPRPDTLPSINITGAQPGFSSFVREGEPVTFTLTRDGNADHPFTVRALTYEPNHPEATPGSSEPPGNPSGQFHYVTFKAESSTATLTVSPDLDGVPESGLGTLFIVVKPEDHSPYQAHASQPMGRGITVKDPLPVVTIAADQTSVTEGAKATFTVSLDGPTSGPVAVNISVYDPGAFLRGNYWKAAPSLPATVTVLAGNTSATVSLTTKDDSRDIPNHALTVSVTADNSQGGPYYVIGGDSYASVTVTDDDVAPELEVSFGSATVEEGESLTITIERHGETKNPVMFELSHGFLGHPKSKGLRTIEADQTVFTIPVATDDNDRDEAHRTYEAVILPLAEVYPGVDESEYWTVRGSRTAAATVRDDDNPTGADRPAITFQSSQPGESVREGEQVTYTLHRTGATTDQLTVRVYTVEILHPEAASALNNPTALYHHVTFDAGDDTATLTVTADFDGVPEDTDRLDAVISPEENSPYRTGSPHQSNRADRGRGADGDHRRRPGERDRG